MLWSPSRPTSCRGIAWGSAASREPRFDVEAMAVAAWNAQEFYEDWGRVPQYWPGRPPRSDTLKRIGQPTKPLPTGRAIRVQQPAIVRRVSMIVLATEIRSANLGLLCHKRPQKT